MSQSEKPIVIEESLKVKGARATLPVSVAITKETFSLPKKGDEDEVYR